MKRKWIVEVPGHVYDVIFDEERVLAANENKLLLVDDKDVVVLYSHEAPIYKVRKYRGALLLAAEDKKLVKVDSDSIEEINVDHGLFALATKDDKIVAGGCCGAIYLIKNNQIVRSIYVGNHVYDISWSKYIYVASFDGSVYAFDEELNLVKRVDLSENVNVVRTCKDKVAVGTFEPGGVFVFDEDLNLLWSRGGYLDVRVVAWREGCKGLYVGSWDGELSLYTANGDEVLRGKGPRGIESGAWRMGSLVIGGWGRVELYEEEGHELDQSEEAPHKDQ